MFEVTVINHTTSGDISSNSVAEFDNGGGSFSFTVNSYDKDGKALPWKLDSVEGDYVIQMMGETEVHNWWGDHWDVTVKNDSHWWKDGVWYSRNHKSDNNRGNGNNKENAPEEKGDFPIYPNVTRNFAQYETAIKNDENANDWDLSYPLPRGAKFNNQWFHDNNQQKDKSQQNTANCYIAFAQERYRFPVVYGNAIKNGKPNEDVLNKGYCDYAGNPITQADIPNAASVELLWSDLNIGNRSMINWIHGLDENNNQITDDNGNLQQWASGKSIRYIQFRFRTESMTGYQGNAIICVKDKDGNILWSWHIWAIDFRTPYEKLVNVGEWQFFPFHLGRAGGIKTGNPRVSVMHFIQLNHDGTPNGKTADIVLAQDKGKVGTTILDNSGLHYQWGRKDPYETGRAVFRFYKRDDIGNGKYRETADFVNGESRIISHTSESNGSIPSSIKNPMAFYTGSGNWWSGTLANGSNDLWCDDIKTIYDPCPPGFKVPSKEQLDAIAGRLSDGGMRDNTGTTTASGKYYWASGYNGGYSDCVSSTPGSYNPAYGFSIIPVRDRTQNIGRND